jgi:hypothetical protein
MKITINKTGRPNQKLWDMGYKCWLIKKIFGIFIIGYNPPTN